MRRFFIRGLLSLYLTVGFALPAPAQSLLDAQWMAEATPAAVQALLDRGAEVNARNRDGFGFTPLHRAAQVNKTPAYRMSDTLPLIFPSISVQYRENTTDLLGPPTGDGRRIGGFCAAIALGSHAGS